MAVFRCILVDRDGREQVLFREAGSREEVARLFCTGDLFLVSAEESSEGMKTGGRRAGMRAVREFTLMLGMLLDSGLLMKDALAVAGEIASDAEVKVLVSDILESVRKGESLSRSLDAWGGSFPPIYRGMVRIGERVGSLERVFPRLSGYLSERKALRDKMAGAMAYPLLVLCVAVVGAVAIMAFLVPRILEIFDQLGGEGSARVRESVAIMQRFLCGGGLLVLSLVALVLFAVLARRRGHALAEKVDGFLLRMPLLGSFLAGFETLNFAFAMETLTAGGVSVEEGLAEAASVISNAAYRSAISESCEAVLRGESLSMAMGKRREIPRYVAQWVAIGERSGQVERVFQQLRSFYQAEMERRSSRLMALVEPVLILLVGGLILMLVFFFVIPLFSVYTAIL